MARGSIRYAAAVTAQKTRRSHKNHSGPVFHVPPAKKLVR
jgi:hypothetical protein